MKSERISLDQLCAPGSDSLLQELAGRINQGAVFVYPTETIYGIGGSTKIPSVSSAIYEAKKRPLSSSMIHLAGKTEVFRSLLDNAHSAEQFLAKTFWPGLLTIVIASEDNPGGTAIRVSDHPCIKRLYDVLDIPIYSTSANVSGEPYNPDPDYIYGTFSSCSDFMIDAHVLPPSPPSTVVKFADQGTLDILREGVLSKAAIRNAFETAGYTVTVR